MLPKRAVFRDNLALYSNYAGDFETGETEARTVLELVPTDAYAKLALAMAQTGHGRIDEARATYQELATMKEIGATFAASGLADLAAYEGRYTEATRLFQDGAAADLAAKNPDRAAAKLAALAHVQLWRGQRAAAVASAERALGLSKAPKVRFLAARVFAEAGQSGKARPLAEGLAAEIQPERQAYGKIVEAMLARQSSDARPAIKLLTEANTLMDTWIGRFELGRAFLATKQYPQADSEFARCLKRKGEAISLFLDEEPTFAFFPAVHYYQARAREELGVGGFAESYRLYLSAREKAGEDPLAADARKRAGK
jgi:tetratricopeptide (TPR) repeat protein